MGLCRRLAYTKDSQAVIWPIGHCSGHVLQCIKAFGVPATCTILCLLRLLSDCRATITQIPILATCLRWQMAGGICT